MHPSSYNEAARLVATYLPRDKALRILDVGAYDVNGTYRPLFDAPDWKYEGADAAAGPNVMHVLLDPYCWTLPGTYDVIISGQTLEHVEFFWLTWREMVRYLKPGGLIFLLLPSAGPEHRYPVDCWRFYRDGMTALGKLEGLEVVEAKTLLTEEPWRDTVGVFRKALS
jgi:SAM-dependent methyltransferase